MAAVRCSSAKAITKLLHDGEKRGVQYCPAEENGVQEGMEKTEELGLVGREKLISCHKSGVVF